MNFYVMSKSYNSYGAHKTLSPIGHFLLAGSGSFGDAIKEIVVTLYFKDSGPALSTLEFLMEKHKNYRSTLVNLRVLDTSHLRPEGTTLRC